MPIVSHAGGVAITNPLVLYRSLVATRRLENDPGQHRLALHLQILYENLKDYEPVVEYKTRLSDLSRELGQPRQCQHVERSTSQPGFLGGILGQRNQQSSLSLTRVLTSHEETLQMKSPKGLMLHGEVGTGKSMLIDLFADCLPNRRKKRWHFTTFMLDILSKLERLRHDRLDMANAAPGLENDYSMLWLARDMISTSPILFLDEFQIPDRAASKILTNLMTYFFHLGGVLIATSNRMPEELAKAAGMEFAAPPPPIYGAMDSLKTRFGMGMAAPASFHRPKDDFTRFLEVLHARCDIWQIEGGKDYRRREAEQNLPGKEPSQDIKISGSAGLKYDQPNVDESATNATPRFYLIASEDNCSAALESSLEAALPTVPKPIAWSSSTMTVYGRKVTVPRQHAGICHFSFEELCVATYGPADYLTLASTFHTLILTNVPILSLLQKNEARRFITLLDALYEARCKLLVTAVAGPDDIFFPEAHSKTDGDGETVDQDAILAETLAEAYQDVNAPFRPNISAYEPGITSPQEPDFTHSRLAGTLADDQLEDDPPNRRHKQGSEAVGRGDSIHGLDGIENPSIDVLRARLQAQRLGPNFQDARIYTGEDEKFAYQRARSRLWEMCGSQWWSRDESDNGWWQPLDQSLRTWEQPAKARARPGLETRNSAGHKVHEGFEGVRDMNDKVDEVLFKYGHNASPFRRQTDGPPPSFAWTHVWGFMKWGKKAGAWGQGVDNLDGRAAERRRMREDSKKVK